MNQAQQLYHLQQIDSQIDQHNRRLEEIHLLLNDDNELQAAKDAHQAADKIKADAERALKHAEFYTQAQRDKIKNNQIQLFGGSVKNPKVLQDLQLESEALKRYLEVLEDAQLEAMIVFEETDANAQDSVKQVAQFQARQIELHAALNGESSKLSSMILQLQNDRISAAGVIPEDLLQVYEKLRSTRRGVGVAKVVHQSCGACGDMLTSAHLQSARSPSILVKCSTCGRFLYAE